MFSSLLFSLERSLSFFTPTLKSSLIKALLRVETKTERERKKKRFSRRVEEETLRRERRKGTVLLVLVLHDRRRERTWKRL